ncbi:MAG: DUF362 domain-containing protein [Deltaproteobacteria bacterium]|nr:DUF362 domain-containing protein [Deltaproteobacteria bacterium]
MRRRELLKGITGAFAAMVFSHSRVFGAPQDPQRKNPPVSKQETKVFLAGVPRGASEEALKSAVRETLLAASDFSWLSRGDSVFIKPALNSGNPYPATTSPPAIAAVISLLKEKGARRVIVGDMAGIEHVKLSPESLSGSSRKLMETSGLAKAVLAAGGEVHFFEESGWKSFYEDPMINGLHWKQGLMMPNILKEVDHILLMPRCSRHVLAGATLGLKAVVGYWRTDTRLEYHRDASTLQEKTAEANTARTLVKKQRLIISAADKILTTIGPDTGHVYQPEIGLIIASESVVAHDMVSLAWLLENRRLIPPDKKGKFADNSPIVAWLANYWVVHRLGGWKPTLASDRLVKNDLKTIWDDRVLGRAYHVFNGLPKVALREANRNLPEDLKKRLNGMTRVG